MSAESLLGRRPDSGATRFAIVVGDQEDAQSTQAGLPADLTLEAGRLHARLRRRPETPSSLRVVGGGHDEEVWLEHVVEAAVRAGLGPGV